MAKVRDVIELMEYIAPPWMAAKGDVTGLQAGGRDDRVRKILVALDATDKVIDYAVKNKCDMIVAHHPRFYRPLKNICKDTFSGNIAYKLNKNDIAVFNAHTNFDAAPGGVNDILADIAGILDCKPVAVTADDKFVKLTVYVPEDYLEVIRDELAQAGAGEIGNYSECSYRTIGIGMFRVLDDATPAVGALGELVETEEWRLEVVLPLSMKNSIENVLLSVHPYEEPAYDFSPVMRSVAYGQGRVGDLEREITLAGLARRFKKATASKSVSVLGNKNTKIKRVVLWSGSGVDVDRVLAVNPQCIVCGELGYHQAEELEYAGVNAVVLGHGPCEELALVAIVDSLKNGISDVDVLLSPRLWPDFVSI